MTSSAPAPLAAPDRPEVDASDPRRAITHALACGPRLGWQSAERADGDAVVVTYSRGTGSAAQVIEARFVVMTLGGPVDFYRFTAGALTLTAGAAPAPVRVWGHVMSALYSAPAKAHRAAAGTRPRR